MQSRKIGYLLLGLIGIIAIVGYIIVPPIGQNEEYHIFGDRATILSIPNFWNVISNVTFSLVGIFGIFSILKLKEVNWLFMTFLIGISLIGIGSGYYHYMPNSKTLIWDRLPMTIAFTSLISMVVSEFINNKAGRLLLLPLLALGFYSIFVWIKFDDLRLYALVQYVPIIAIPIILIFFKSENSTKGFWQLVIVYAIAKIFEIFDFEIYTLLKVISGHSIKHIIASLGVFLLIIDYKKTKSKPAT